MVLSLLRQLPERSKRPRATAGTVSTTYFFTYSRSYYLIHPPTFRHMALGPRPTHFSGFRFGDLKWREAAASPEGSIVIGRPK